MKAREPDAEGYVETGGVKVHYEVHGEGRPTILLLPTWTIIHKRFWKLQIPYLARHHRVVTYDGPGNGLSDRPLDPAAYSLEAHVAHAVAVLDSTRTQQAVVVGLSMGAWWGLGLAACHPDRVVGSVLIGPSLPLSKPGQDRLINGPGLSELPPSRVPSLGTDPPSHWAKYDPTYWRSSYEDFLWFFFGMCFPEPRSTKQIEDCVGWGRDTTAEVLIAQQRAEFPDADTVREWCRSITTPVLAIHGDQDLISPLARSQVIADLTGGELVTIAEGGHIPLARDPVKVNHLIHDFALRVCGHAPRGQTWMRGPRRRKRVLYLCSPIGLGHARRDLAIEQELRTLREDIEVDWLAQHPVTRVLEADGRRLHPASRWLANESRHIESESGEHDLHCFEALRRMDEIMVNNFMVFDDVVREGHYDLVVGDEAWDVDHFLHENPELKHFAYAWLTDFVGYLPFPDGGEREALVAADYNAEMIEHIERYPRLRDRAIFVGDRDDIVPDSFGPGLPLIREWTQQHYDFCGYVTGIDLATVADRARLRAELGWDPDEQVCVVTVGGSGVGGHLLRRVSDTYDVARARMPGLRMVVITGPRIDPSAIRARSGLDVHEYVPNLYRHLAASDLAIVQGGLTTTMELTAAGRPFLYIPLQHHFEQQYHVAHRLSRYHAGRRLNYHDLTPDSLAHAIATEIGQSTAYRPVASNGAARAAAMLAELL